MTNMIYIHQPEKAFSFTRLPNFLFEASIFNPLSNEAKVLYAFYAGQSYPARTARQTNTGGFICIIPFARWSFCFTVDGRKRSTSCGRYSMWGLWRYRNRAVETPTAFTQNPMRRFQTPTSRNPILVRRGAENRTHRVR